MSDAAPERLREMADAHFRAYPPARRIVGQALSEAADALTTAQARIAELEAALTEIRDLDYWSADVGPMIAERALEGET